MSVRLSGIGLRWMYTRFYLLVLIRWDEFIAKAHGQYSDILLLNRTWIFCSIARIDVTFGQAVDCGDFLDT